QWAAVERIRGIHRRVHGTLRTAVGPFPAGTNYSAEDPALVLWVHLSLLESMVLVHDALFGDLSEAERDAYCAEAAWVPVALGAGVLAPPLGPLVFPLSAAVRFVTRAWLPESIRDQYGLAWSEADARRLPMVLTTLRASRRLLPARVAFWPESRIGA